MKVINNEPRVQLWTQEEDRLWLKISSSLSYYDIWEIRKQIIVAYDTNPLMAVQKGIEDELGLRSK